MLLKVYNKNPQMRAITQAVEMLKNGGLVVYPTDTIYRLGCDLHNKKAESFLAQPEPSTNNSRP